MQVQKTPFSLWAFTLVELIVVITIVGILSTIGFVSYSGYLVWARDSNRLWQLANLTEALQIFSTSKRLPLPDGAIDIEANGNLVAFQWNAGINVIDALEYNNWGRDPRDKLYFSYMVSQNRKSFQLLAFMEETGALTRWIIPQVHAINYSERFAKTYGNNLWILTSGETDFGLYNTPAHLISWVTQVDLVNTTDDYIAHISDTQKIEWDGPILTQANPIHSCRRIKETWLWLNSTIYTINPDGAGELLVYCDMETKGWGWTLIARSTPDGTGAFSWGADTGNVQSLTSPYVLGTISNLTYNEAMMASYAIKRRIIDTSIISTSSVSTLSEGTHTLWVDGITWGTLTGQWMFFVR